MFGKEGHHLYTREWSNPVAPAYSKRYKDMKSSLFQGALWVLGGYSAHEQLSRSRLQIPLWDARAEVEYLR